MTTGDATRTDAKRRRFLLGAIAGILASGAAAKLVIDASDSGIAVWVADVLRRNLRGTRVDEDSIARLLNELEAQDVFSTRRRLAILGGQTFPTWSRRFAASPNASRVVERLVVSQFLLGSDFLKIDGQPHQKVTYYGQPSACGNPFAVFRDT